MQQLLTSHLLEDGQIRHRDVPNNIIITDSATDGGPRGRLIDLDLAKELDSVPSGVVTGQALCNSW
jgi:hypothetical protein